MLLYYFTSLRHGLSAIREQRLKVSRFDTLNDPYDHVNIFVREADDVAEHRRIKQQVLDEEGVICMSRTYEQPLLWGHYADNHRGMCLVFEVPEDNQWRDIDYVEHRPKVRRFGVNRFGDLSKSQLLDIAHTKYDGWEYEEEVRRLVFLDDYDFADDIHYQEFDDFMRFRGALFGSRCTISQKQLAALLAFDEGFHYSFTKPAGGAFRVRLDKDENRKRQIDENRWIRRRPNGELILDGSRVVW